MRPLLAVSVLVATGVLAACGGSSSPTTTAANVASRSTTPAQKCADAWNAHAPTRWHDELRGLSAGYGPTDALVLAWNGKPMSVGTISSEQDNHFTGRGTIKPGSCAVAYNNDGKIEGLIFIDGSTWKEAGPDRLPKATAAPIYALAHRKPNATIDIDGRVKLTP